MENINTTLNENKKYRKKERGTRPQNRERSIGLDVSLTPSKTPSYTSPQNISSILSSELILPNFTPDKYWYKNQLLSFYKNENISNIFIHNNCGHFYRVKTNSNFYKYKTGTFKYYKKGKCLVCDKLYRTPALEIKRDEQGIIDYKNVAECLIGEYMRLFNRKIPYDKYFYTLYDCEICFYIWLYNDRF